MLLTSYIYYSIIIIEILRLELLIQIGVNEMSRPKKYPSTTVKSIRFPDSLLLLLNERATKRLTTLNQYIIHALQEYTK